MSRRQIEDFNNLSVGGEQYYIFAAMHLFAAFWNTIVLAIYMIGYLAGT
jgi:hypothetical protein